MVPPHLTSSRRPSRLALCGCLGPAPGALVAPRAAVLGAGLRAAPSAAQLGDTVSPSSVFLGKSW